MTESLFGAGGVFDDDVRARTQHQASLDVFEARGGQLPRKPPNPIVTEIRPGDRIEGEGWHATVGESSHMQPYLQCYGYRIESEAGIALLCGRQRRRLRKRDHARAQGRYPDPHDALRIGDRAERAVQRSSGGHLDVAEVARRAEVGTLVITHVTPHIDMPGTRERLISEMAKIYGGPIIWGEDLMTLSVPHVSYCGID